MVRSARRALRRCGALRGSRVLSSIQSTRAKGLLPYSITFAESRFHTVIRWSLSTRAACPRFSLTRPSCRSPWPKVRKQMDDSICWLSAKELLKAYDRGNLSPLEVCAALSARVEQLDSAIRAFTAVSLSQALRDAKACTEELAHGFRRGPLHGVPVAIKELFDVEG